LVLLAYSWALLHHMLGGLRHLVWDTGHGFSIAQVNALSWFTIIGSVVLTLALWLVGLTLRGELLDVELPHAARPRPWPGFGSDRHRSFLETAPHRGGQRLSGVVCHSSDRAPRRGGL